MHFFYWEKGSAFIVGSGSVKFSPDPCPTTTHQNNNNSTIFIVFLFGHFVSRSASFKDWIRIRISPQTDPDPLCRWVIVALWELSIFNCGAETRWWWWWVRFNYNKHILSYKSHYPRHLERGKKKAPLLYCMGKKSANKSCWKPNIKLLYSLYLFLPLQYHSPVGPRFRGRLLQVHC